MINSTEMGFKMVNYNLAASNNLALAQTPNAGLLANTASRILRQVVTMAKHIDRRAQVFFNAQATTRSRKVEKIQWGFEAHTGF